MGGFWSHVRKRPKEPPKHICEIKFPCKCSTLCILSLNHERLARAMVFYDSIYRELIISPGSTKLHEYPLHRATESTRVELYCKDTEETGAITKAINFAFEELKGREIDWFEIWVDVRDNQVYLDEIVKALAGKELNVKVLAQYGLVPSNKLSRYIREKVNFTHFCYKSQSLPEEEGLELDEKILNCEFLYLECLFKNPEALENFKGWGLSLRKASVSYFDLSFLFDVFHKWMAGEEPRFKYLYLDMKFKPEIWEEFDRIGEEVLDFNHLKPYYHRKIRKITRKDGEICHIFGLDDFILCFTTLKLNKEMLVFTAMMYYNELDEEDRQKWYEEQQIKQSEKKKTNQRCFVLSKK